MDADRFDQLTISIAEARSRRGILRAAGGLAATLAALGLETDFEVEASKKRQRPRRRKECKGNKTRCKRRCVNLRRDDKNCGSCGTKCRGGTSCKKGECVCPDECCRNRDCPGGEVCENGSCTCPTECCVNDDCDGTEVCQNGSCTCLTECCVNGDCPQPGGACLPNGTCNCGQCCFNDECAANENCVLVGETRSCFCKPELICGVVCCPQGTTCSGGSCVL